MSEAAGRRFVRFDRGSADRIAKTVLTVERMAKPTAGLGYEHPIPGAMGKVFRIGNYTGSWPIDTSKTITPIYGNTATISAYNHFLSLDHGTCSSTVYKCAIAKDGTGWYLVQPEMRTATTILLKSVATTVVLTDVTISFNTANCSIAKTNVTALVVGIGQTATGSYLFIPAC
jgi:hypothetical protein